MACCGFKYTWLSHVPPIISSGCILSQLWISSPTCCATMCVSRLLMYATRACANIMQCTIRQSKLCVEKISNVLKLRFEWGAVLHMFVQTCVRLEITRAQWLSCVLYGVRCAVVSFHYSFGLCAILWDWLITNVNVCFLNQTPRHSENLCSI